MSLKVNSAVLLTIRLIVAQCKRLIINRTLLYSGALSIISNRVSVSINPSYKCHSFNTRETTFTVKEDQGL